MKTNSKPNTLISLRAAEAMARRAVSAAEAERKARRAAAKPNKAHKKRPQTPSLGREIRSIFKAMSSDAALTTKAVMQQPPKGACCKSVITVYKVADLQRQEDEEKELDELAKQGVDRRDLPKPYKAKPVVTYALYPSTLDSNRLGSVAIYGDDNISLLTLIRKSGSLFGHTVIEAKLEMGIRPFIDVRLR